MIQASLCDVEPIGGTGARVTWSAAVEIFVIEQARIAGKRFQIDVDEFVGDALQTMFERVQDQRCKGIKGVKSAVWNLARDRVRRRSVRDRHGANISAECAGDFTAQKRNHEGELLELISGLGSESPILLVVGAAIDFGVPMATIAKSYGYAVGEFRELLMREYRTVKLERMEAESSLC